MNWSSSPSHRATPIPAEAEGDQDPADETASPGRAQERQHDVRADRQHEDLEDRLGVEVHGVVFMGAVDP